MNLAPPIRGFGRPAADAETVAVERAMVNRTPVKSRAGAVRRERHQADYVILDLPPLSSPAARIAASHCDALALMVDREAICVAASGMAADLLRSWTRGEADIGAVIINRTPLATILSQSEIRAQVKCEILGMIPHDMELCANPLHKGAPLVVPSLGVRITGPTDVGGAAAGSNQLIGESGWMAQYDVVPKKIQGFIQVYYNDQPVSDLIPYETHKACLENMLILDVQQHRHQDRMRRRHGVDGEVAPRHLRVTENSFQDDGMQGSMMSPSNERRIPSIHWVAAM